VLTAVNLSADSADIDVGSVWDASYSFFGGVCRGGILHLAPYERALLSR